MTEVEILVHFNYIIVATSLKELPQLQKLQFENYLNAEIYSPNNFCCIIFMNAYLVSIKFGKNNIT